MVHYQLKFSSVLALNFMCTYAVHILIYSTALQLQQPSVKFLFILAYIFTVFIYSIGSSD